MKKIKSQKKPNLQCYIVFCRIQFSMRCATSRKVPGSIPGGVTGFFIDIFPSDRTMTVGSTTQPLVKMNTRNIHGGKGGRCVRLTTYHHTVPLSRNLGALSSQTPLGLQLPVTEVLCLCLTVFHATFFQDTEREATLCTFVKLHNNIFPRTQWTLTRDKFFVCFLIKEKFMLIQIIL